AIRSKDGVIQRLHLPGVLRPGDVRFPNDRFQLRAGSGKVQLQSIDGRKKRELLLVLLQRITERLELSLDCLCLRLQRRRLSIVWVGAFQISSNQLRQGLAEGTRLLDPFAYGGFVKFLVALQAIAKGVHEQINK